MKHKQLLSGLCALLTAGTMLGSAMPAFALDPPRYGDFNQDGEITVEDAQLVLQIYADNMAGVGRTLTEWEITLADVDKDGTVDLPDAQFILLYYAENTLGGNDKSWEVILNPPTDYDYALGTLETFMDSLLAMDVDAAFDSSDFLYVMSISEGDDFDEEEIRSGLAAIGYFIGSYEILGGKEEPELLEIYNDETARLITNAKVMIAHETDPEKRAELERVSQLFLMLDGLYVFDMTLDWDGEQVDETVYVGHRDGKWYVDTMVVGIVLGNAED